MSAPEYAELRCMSSYSFLIGASQPEQLVERARELGYAALAITDECSMAGVVRAHVAAQASGVALLVGAQFNVGDGEEGGAAPVAHVVVLAASREGYGNLCQFITAARARAPKGAYRVDLDQLCHADLAECLVIATPSRQAGVAVATKLATGLREVFQDRLWLGFENQGRIDDAVVLEHLQVAAEASGVPLVATGNVRMHRRSRQALQDLLTAIRVGRPLTECGQALAANAERHLRPRERLGELYPPELLAETIRVAERCHFELGELRYEYPDELVPPGATASGHLRRLVYDGSGRRWPAGVPAQVQVQIKHELALIAELRYEPYFLSVHDIVAFARSRHILCQGRGSAANSVVCYCLGITEVDPARMNVLFERFISRERNEPPDIDVDFEHQRREEVIQYLYGKYGRDRAALTAVATTYRPRSAIRDVGKALGLAPAAVEALAKAHHGWDRANLTPERLAEAGLDAEDLAVRQLVALVDQLVGLPRHLSQHPGGFVLARGPLSRLVPIEPAAMEDRVVIQWDKDDLDALGLLKVDVLALGMLSAIRRTLEGVSLREGYTFGLQDIPAEDEATYKMIGRADTVGVFQIESRAQMSMLPRLKPECFYDLVIEVAIVRPGPIQGGMVHPYLRRRQGLEPVTYPSAALEQALGRTLGVPVFQEQVMQVAILAAGFSPGEADGLRRAMAAWKRKGGLDAYQARLVQGMRDRGYDDVFIGQICEQIRGFSEYGFPESHAASFALLVYASSWLKCHYPAEFLTGLLNSQPLGFYSPGQLVQDARRHGVEVRPVDVMHSQVDSTLEDLPGPPAVRLGLGMVAGLREGTARRIAEARRARPFESTEDLALRAGLEQHEVTRLAGADALLSLSGHRRQQVWDASALRVAPELLREVPVNEAILELAPAPEGEEVVWDYASTGLTLRSHPLALLRPRLAKLKCLTAEQLHEAPNGRVVRACGLVTVRQQPGTANGVTFVSLEDETGSVQVIVWRSLRERQRAPLLQSRLLAVRGTWQRQGEVRNLIAGHLEDLTPLLGKLATESRDFR